MTFFQSVVVLFLSTVPGLLPSAQLWAQVIDRETDPSYAMLRLHEFFDQNAKPQLVNIRYLHPAFGDYQLAVGVGWTSEGKGNDRLRLVAVSMKTASASSRIHILVPPDELKTILATIPVPSQGYVWQGTPLDIKNQDSLQSLATLLDTWSILVDYGRKNGIDSPGVRIVASPESHAWIAFQSSSNKRILLGFVVRPIKKLPVAQLFIETSSPFWELQSDVKASLLNPDATTLAFGRGRAAAVTSSTSLLVWVRQPDNGLSVFKGFQARIIPGHVQLTVPLSHLNQARIQQGKLFQSRPESPDDWCQALAFSFDASREQFDLRQDPLLLLLRPEDANP